MAEAAIHAGAEMINDVSGFVDPDMREVAASRCGLTNLSHAYAGKPVTMQD